MDISFFERHPPAASHDPQRHAVGVSQLSEDSALRLEAVLVADRRERDRLGDAGEVAIEAAGPAAPI